MTEVIDGVNTIYPIRSFSSNSKNAWAREKLLEKENYFQFLSHTEIDQSFRVYHLFSLFLEGLLQLLRSSSTCEIAKSCENL